MTHEIVFDEDSHIYLVDGKQVPSVTEILSPLHRSYGKVNSSVLDYAARRGKAVHEALEDMDYDLEAEVYPEIIGYIDAYEDWSNVYRPTWTGIEQIVYNEADGYIGTLDRIGYLNGSEFAVVDIKTSQPTKEALVSVCLQTEAYALAYEAEQGVPTGINRYGLFLKSDGTWRWVDCNEYEQKYDMPPLAWENILQTHHMITKLLETKGRK